MASLRRQQPFSLLAPDDLNRWLGQAKLLKMRPGQQLLKPNQLQNRIYLVMRGTVRFLAQLDEREVITLDRRGAGQFLGWVSLLRAEPCEWVSASEETQMLALPAEHFLNGIQTTPAFADWFAQKVHPQEAFVVASAALELQVSVRTDDWRELLQRQWPQARVVPVAQGTSFIRPAGMPDDMQWYLSSAQVANHRVGECLVEGTLLPARAGDELPYRVVGLPLTQDHAPQPADQQLPVDDMEQQLPVVSLQQLGILEDDTLADSQRYPLVRGQGTLQEALAVCEMAALQQQVPFRRDALQKVLEDQFRRDKSLSLELLAGLMELMGLKSQLGGGQPLSGQSGGSGAADAGGLTCDGVCGEARCPGAGPSAPWPAAAADRRGAAAAWRERQLRVASPGWQHPHAAVLAGAGSRRCWANTAGHLCWCSWRRCWRSCSGWRSPC